MVPAGVPPQASGTAIGHLTGPARSVLDHLKVTAGQLPYTGGSRFWAVNDSIGRCPSDRPGARRGVRDVMFAPVPRAIRACLRQTWKTRNALSAARRYREADVRRSVVVVRCVGRPGRVGAARWLVSCLWKPALRRWHRKRRSCRREHRRRRLLRLRPAQVWAWGDDLEDQIGGAGHWFQTTVLVAVRGLNGAVAIAAGQNTGYAVLPDGTVWAWGGDKGLGQLGSGTHRPSSDTPVRVRGLGRVVAISAGSETGYALDRQGNLWAWGYGAYGQLGDGSAANSDVPVRVRKLSHVVEVAGGGDMAYALDRQGNL